MSEAITSDVVGNNSGNRLGSVSGLTGDYSYDANGNATIDGRNGMALSYTYDAAGRKLTKNAKGSLRQYVDGIEY